MEKAAKNIKTSILKKPGMRIGLVISSLMIVVVCIILAFWLAKQSLFSANPHFTIRHIDVRSSGWWNGKESEMANLLEIRTGSTNLFAINLQYKHLVLASQPGIENVSMARVLPDTLQINIVERIPRAYLYNSNSSLLVDSGGNVMDARTCVNLKKNLPVITGFRADRRPAPGDEMGQLKQAMELIMLVVKKYPEIRILKLSLGTPKEIQMSFMSPVSDTPMCAIFARAKFDEKLLVLREALRQKKLSSNPATTIDLRFEGQVIFKPPEITEEE